MTYEYQYITVTGKPVLKEPSTFAIKIDNQIGGRPIRVQSNGKINKNCHSTMAV